MTTPAVSDTSSASPGQVVVIRNTPDDLRQREVHVYLDGERIGVLMYGRRVSRPVAPGRHTVRVYNTLVSKSIDVEVAAGQTVAFDTGNRAAGCLLGGLMLIGVGPMSVFIRPAVSEANAAPPDAES